MPPRKKQLHFWKDLDHIVDTKKNSDFSETCHGGGLCSMSTFLCEIKLQTENNIIGQCTR